MKSSSIKIRVKAEDGKIHLRALIKHPMETGRRKDAATGDLVPAHFINSVVVESNGEAVFSADWSTSVAADPFLSIVFDGKAGDNVRLAWQDNTGRSDSIEKQVV